MSARVDRDSDDGREHMAMPPLPLCKHIRSILSRYPDGGQILKELLQNASDAQATRVQFLLNSQEYGTQTLIHENMAPLQGAALYEYNDGVFAPEDWKGICQLERSRKKNNAMKVGRFGIGFNSVYHLTDVPCVISSTHVGFFDPMLCHHTGYDADEEATEMVRFPVKKFAAQYADQCATLNVLEHVVKPHQDRFDGTLFRFPLRQKVATRHDGDDDDDGDDSVKLLSSTIYSEADVEDKLFPSFSTEASVVLLFLSNVRRVEIHRQSTSGAAKRLLQVRSVCGDNAEEDALFSEHLRNASQSLQPSTVETVVQMSVDSAEDGHRVQPWLVQHTVGSEDPAILQQSRKFKLHAWVGVAASIGADDSWNTSWAISSSPVSGLAFCFLPLPIETGLPVHVHGYFAITDNRRSIKWPRPDDSSKASESQWNRHLVRLCLCPAYVAMLTRLASKCQFRQPPTHSQLVDSDASRACRAYYAWPDVDKVQASMDSPWNFLVQCMVPLLFSEPLLWSWANGGKWLSVREAWIMAASSDDAIEPGAIEAAGQRLIPAQAAKRIYTFLCALGEPVVLLPAHVLRTLRSSSEPSLENLLAKRTISPETLRSIVRRLQSSGGASRQFLQRNKSTACDILCLVIADLTGDSPQLSAVSDLAIFPTLGASPVRDLRGSTVYIPKGRRELVDILPGLEDQMLDTVSDAGIQDDTRQILETLAQQSGETSPLQLLTDKQVPALLKQSIVSWSPGFQLGVESVEWKPGSQHPGDEWLRKVWNWCGRIKPLSLLEGLPLIPAHNSADPPYGHLFALLRDPVILFAVGMKDALKLLLSQAGCVVIAGRPAYMSHENLTDYALTDSQRDVLAALQSAVKRAGIDEVNSRLAALPPATCKELVAFLAAGCDDTADRYADYAEFLQQLQVYTCHQTNKAVKLSGGKHCLLPRSLPEKVLRLQYPPCYLHPAASENEVSFMTRLGCLEATESDLLLSHLLPAISQQANATTQQATAVILKFTMDMILRDNLESDALVKMKAMAFVPRVTAGPAARPTDLVDPEDSLAPLYSASDGQFPDSLAGVELGQWLAALRRVGLKQEKHLTDYDKEVIVKERVASVSHLMNGQIENRPAVVARAKHLLEFILRMEAPESCSRYLGEEGACFVACQRPGGEEYPTALPWCGVDPTMLYTGKQLVSLSRDAQPHLLAGSSSHLLHPDLAATIGNDETVLRSFALRSSSGLYDSVVLHLQQMMTTLSSVTGEQRKSLQRYYDSSTEAIYSYLAELQARQPGECKTALQTHMGAGNWVWLPSLQKFVSPHSIVERLPADIPSLAPLWYTLDGERQHHFPLFLAFGARESLDGGDLYAVLDTIRAGLSASDRLSESQIQLVLAIINSSVMTSAESTASSVLLPTAQCLLVEAETCTFCDRPFLDVERELYSRFNTLHSSVPHTLAERYGAAPLSLKLLPSRSLSCEDVGKSEIILHHLKDTTWSDASLFNEMIQNADDAGATIVKFRLDGCTHEVGSEKVLSEEMQQWQGPALWVHNNALVSEDDIQSMTKLGQSSKRGRLGLIGHRGIGFSSIFHLTDMPSFVSGSNVVFIDPHGGNLARRSSRQTPAVVIDFVKQQDGVHAFADQFNLYNNVFGCQLTHTPECTPVEQYSGTLFRLPLRNILGKASLNTLQKSLQKLVNRADQLLLFMNHVRELVVEVVSDTGEQCTLCHVCVTTDQLVYGDPRADRLLSDTVMRTTRLEDISASTPPNTVYIADVREASDSNNSRPPKQWIVAGTFGGAESVECARRLKESEYALALVPWVSVAVPINDGMVVPTCGEVFSFLPLSMETHLPVHVNGFFLQSTDGTGCLAAGENAAGQWNHSLLHRDVPRAYCLLLEGARTLLHSKPMPITYEMAESLYTMLPHDALQQPWRDVQRTILKKLISDTAFLWTSAGERDGQWIDLMSALILEHISSSEVIPELMKDILLHQDENYVTVINSESHPLRKVLAAADRGDCIMPFEQFFADKFLTKLDQLPHPQADTWLQCLLGHALTQCDNNWLVPLMREAKCLRSRTGQLCLPRDLIDPQPDDVNLKSLFSECHDLLPSGYLKEFLPHYRSCGLISSAKQLSEAVLLQQARRVSEHAKRQALHLCHVLEAKLLSAEPPEEFISELRKIPFLPVLPKPSEWCLDWKATRDEVIQACFDEVLPHTLHCTVGSVAVFVDNRDLPIACPRLFSLFNIVNDAQPSRDQICEQLRVMIDAAARITESSSRRRKDVVMNISQCVRCLYECMQKQLPGGEVDAAQYSQMRCIWSAEHAAFVYPCRASLSAPTSYGDLMPHRLLVDEEYREQFADLFVTLGVQEHLKADDVHAVLQDIHTCHTDSETGERRQLSANDIQRVIRLVKVLHSDSDFEPEGFLLPTMNGLMLPASDCTFVDRIDLLGARDDDDYDDDDESSQHTVHYELKDIAKALGAVPLSGRVLPSDNLGIEMVGPHEELTARLGTILDEYPCDDTILKELIQNADDAGATRVSFVMDWRDDRGDSAGLLNENMSSWQGPAVLAFNDSVFSSADFANIMKLGGATKREEPGKIGRFGLGFSSVYHLTDVPSFVSGNYIVFCDPHTTNLGMRVTKAQPGVKIDFVNNRKGRKKFSRQFEPYQGIFGCTMQDPYNATLFRLPLRSAQSEIRKKVLTDEDIVGLFGKCWTRLVDILLFLQSVREVSVYEIPKGASVPQLLFKAVSCSGESDTEEGQMARRGLRQLHATHGQGLHDFIANLPEAESKCHQATVTITTEISEAGKRCFVNVPDIRQPESQTWTLSAGLGVKEAKHLAVGSEGITEQLVPWGGCAIKLNDKRLPDAEVVGRAFSFLPLPITTQLPFHLNGCLSVTANRRNLWTNDDSLKTRWNEAILADVIPRTYLSLLESSAALCRDRAGREALNSLFPSPTVHGPAFSSRSDVIGSFYSSLLGGDEFAVFWSSAAGAWLTGRQSLFLMDVDVFKDDYQYAVQLLAHVNKRIVELPPPAVREVLADPKLLSGQVCERADRCMSFREFFETELVEYCADPGAMDMDLYCTLLMCLLNYYDRTPTAQWCLDLLKSKLLIPTSQKSLKLASELVDYTSTVSPLAAMYDDSDGYFPEKALLQGRCQKVLREAGLIHETLPPEYVKERAVSVSLLPQPACYDQAVRRCAAILRYASGKSVELGDAAGYLRNCPFLPVAQHVDGYAFTCAGDSDLKMAAAKDLYLQRHVHVIGSQKLVLDETLLERYDFKMTPCIKDMLRLSEKEPPLDSVIAQFQHVVAVTNGMANSADCKRLSSKQMEDTVLKLYSELDIKKAAGMVTRLPEPIWVPSRTNCRFVKRETVVAPRSSNSREWYGRLVPYCYVLSDALYKFKKLLQVQEYLQQDTLIDVLHHIRNELSNGKLNSRQLDVCKFLLEHLGASKLDLDARQLDRILLPTEDGQLLPAQECTYIDCDFELAATTHHVAALQQRVARRLGAQPMTKRLLKLQPLAFSYKKAGQSEPLTTRLNNNLESYPKGVSILKELIQNADDAGASRVCFLLDTREHGRKTLFGPKMKAWQGPALLCFNDARFLEDDFKNILRLGGATKRAKEDKIGQFGLGFSSVYNITDVPSFVSGQHLVILDPHVHNLGENLIDNANPGITVDFVTGEGVQNFQDQLAPYDNVMGCNVLGTPQAFDGTLFRFPLRSKQAESDISKFLPDAAHIHDILLELCGTAERYLVFLQNVKELSVYVHDSTSPRGEEPFTRVFSCQVTESAPAVQGQLESERRDAMRQWAIGRKESGNTKFSKYAAQCLLTMETKTRSWKPGTAPKGTWNPATTSRWLICSGTGQGSAIQLAETCDVKSKCPVPWGGVALKVDPKTKAVQPVDKGKVFCFLPLPQSQVFPVHINGFFAVASDRHSVKFTDDERDFETKWNECLLRDPIATCYLRALQCWTQWSSVLGRNCSELPSPDTLVKYLPSPDVKCDALWRSLPEALLKLLLEPDAPALFWLPTNGGEWLNACSVCWLDGTEFGEHAQQAINMLQGLGKPALLLPNTYQCRKELFNPINFKSFFLEYFFKHGAEISDEDHATFMQFLLDFSSTVRGGREDWWRCPLASTNCIRSSCDAMVQCSHVVNRTSPLAELYTDEDGKFAKSCYKFTNSHLNTLCDSGMISSHLPNAELLDRARSVRCLGNLEAGRKRADILLKLLAQEDYRDRICGESDASSQLQQIEFLPVLHKPVDYLLSWFGDSMKERFVSVAQSLPAHHQHLAGSMMALVDLCDQPQLSSLLGYEEPLLETVLQQLDSMLDQKIELKEDIAGDDGLLRSDDSAFLQRTSCAVYKYLDGYLADGSVMEATSAEYQTRKDRIVEFLSVKAWVWVEYTGRFVSVRTLTMAGKFNCPPFFNVINPGTELFKCSTLWQAVGVTQDYKPEYILEVMSILHSVYNNASPRRQVPDDHQSGPYPRVTASLLLDLAQELVWHKQDIDSLSKAVLPDKSGLLHYVEDLSYDATHWIPTPVCSDGTPIILASSKVSWQLAEGLGMELSSDRLVESDDIGEDFGQHEPLCERIKTILRKYPPDISIFKELIQNADDAQAEVMHFVLDTRAGHLDEKLLHRGDNSGAWKGLQHCPALCVFNDRPFTERDIDGISKLGCGSKREDLASTGRFGIGFNAVYHLTDCPSFLSRGPGSVARDLCVFDPHLRYVPKARNAAKPGRRYRLSKETEEQFCDQFEPYLGNKLSDVKSATNGSTVFRLPLRSSADEGLSRAWTTEEVEELLRELSKSGTELLLFLNNLSTIRVSVLGDDGRLMELLHVSCDAANKRSNSMPKMLMAELVSNDQQYHCYQQETVLRATGKEDIREKWLMVRCIGVDREQHDGEGRNRNESIEVGHKHGLAPRADIAARLSMPWTPAASECNPNGLLFTALPTPIESGLPVHVNGHFLLDEARTNLDIVKTGDEGIRAWWNAWLLRCVALPAYHHLLDKASHLVTSCDSIVEYDEELDDGQTRVGGDCAPVSPGPRPPLARRMAQRPGGRTTGTLNWYYSLFPLADGALNFGGSMWRDFCTGLYTKIVRSGSKVLASHNANPQYWQPWRPCTGPGAGVFHDFHEHLNQENTSACKRFHLLIGLGVPLTRAPMAILGEITSSENDAGVQETPDYVRNFLLGIAGQLVRAQSLGTNVADVKNIDTLLKYCMQDNVTRDKFDSYGEGLPLLLTESGELKVLSRTSPAFMTTFPALIADRLEQAVSVGLLTSSKVLRKLASHGGCQCLQNLPLCEIATSVRSLHPALLSRKVPRQEAGPLHHWLVSLWRHILEKQPTCRWDNLCQEFNAVSFIPVNCSESGHVLVSADQAQRVIECRHDSPMPLHRGLYKLGMYMPDFENVAMLSDVEVQGCREVASEGWTHPDVCKALVANLSRLQFTERCALTDAEASTLRDRFVSWSRQEFPWRLTHEQLQLLRRLPIYPSVDNKTVSLDGVKEFFQMPAEMPKDGCDVWSRDLQLWIQVMRPLGEHLRMFLTEDLSIRELSRAEIYTKLIVPKLMLMNHEQRLPHLQYIQNTILSDQASDTDKCKALLVGKLREIPFVTASDNRPRTAGELFGRASVFATFVKPAFFPKQFWLGAEWKRLLRKLGFTDEVNKAVFLQLAKTIEAAWDSQIHLPEHLRELTKVESRKASAELTAEFNRLVVKSRTVFLQTKGSDQKGGKKTNDEVAFLNAVGKIRFSFPVSQEHLLRSLLPKSALLCEVDTSSPVSLCQAVSHDWYSLVWTTIPVCDHDLGLSGKGEEGILGTSIPKLLGMKSEPPMQKILRHVSILLGALTDKSCALDRQSGGHAADRKQLVGIFDEIYKYLNAKCSDSEMLALIRISLEASPCILVDDGQMLLPPKQVLQHAFGDHIRMKPYLAKLPESYADRFQALMVKCFHISTHLTPQQCALVLRLINQAHSGTGLEFHEDRTPNEHQLICKCFAELATQLTDNTSVTQENGDLGELFLPCCRAQQLSENDCRSILLVPSEQAVAMDSVSLFARMDSFDKLVYLIPLKEQRAAKVATQLGVRLLSRVVSEVVNSTVIEYPGNCLWESIPPTASTSASATPHSFKDGEEHLICGLVRLLRSDEFGQGVLRILEHFGHCPKVCEEKLQVVRHARFVLVKVLETGLMYAGETIPGSQENQSCHASEKCKPHLTLFIRNETSRSWNDIIMFQRRLAKKICSILELGMGVDGNIPPLIGVLLASEPDEVHKKLDAEGVGRMFQYFGGNASVDYSPPPLGREVPLALGVFDPGENPSELHFSIHQIVVCLIQQGDLDVYILARISAETTAAGTADPHMRRFLVEIKPDTFEEVSVLDLFRFQTEIVDQYLKANGGQELAIFTGTPSANITSGGASSGPEDMDLAKAKVKIKKELQTLFATRDEDVRRKLFKRMQLQWHPDKHPGREHIYTEAFKYLMNLHEHVSKGGNADDFDGESRSGRHDWAEEFSSMFRRHYPRRYPHSGGSTSYSGGSRSGGSSSHRHGHRSSGRGGRRWGDSDFTAFFRPPSSPRGSRSQYEARRWLLQAEFDLAVAQGQVTCHCDQPKNNSLACFMAQQVVEKALKAALYVTADGVTEANRSSHDVDALAQLLSDVEGCEDLAQHACVVSQYYNSTRYPGAAAGFQCPFENFSSDAAQEALVVAKHVVETIGKFIRPRL